MAPPPIVGLDISSAAAMHAPRQRANLALGEAAEPPLLRATAPHAAPEMAFALAGTETLRPSNVIELDAPQSGRAGAFGRAMPAPRPRVDPRGIAFAVRVFDLLIVAVYGIVSYRLQATFTGPIDLTAAFAGLAVMTMLWRLPAAEPGLLQALQRPLSRRLADAAFRTLLPFVLSLLLVTGLLAADGMTRANLTHWLTMWAIGAAVGVCLVRIGLWAMTARWRSAGRLRQAVAIFGTGDLAERLLQRLRASSPDAIELVGVFDDRARGRIASPGLRSLTIGGADDLIALSRHRAIDRVLVALPHSAERRVVEILKKLRQMPVEICLAPDQVGFNLTCREVDEVSGLPLLEVHGQPLTFGQILLKSATDRLLAGLALIVGAPLFLAVALWIKLDSPGPVFFRQNRHGFGDRVIRVFKFRTMADAAADQNGNTQSRPNDPRVTRIGRFLRRWSLDEVPQLINVLRGEMSLVGPRPHAISMRVEDRPNRDIVPDYALRHHVKPGITGWAQVNGYHGPVATEEALRARIRYDLEYINNWSMSFDLQILLRTLGIVFGRRHSY